jgi:hypothetical protein
MNRKATMIGLIVLAVFLAFPATARAASAPVDPAAFHDDMRKLWDLTTVEVVAGLKQDWTADIAAYDEVHGQILMMADMLSAGIVKQFPGKFKKP